MCVSVCTFDFEAGFAWALPSNFFYFETLVKIRHFASCQKNRCHIGPFELRVQLDSLKCLSNCTVWNPWTTATSLEFFHRIFSLTMWRFSIKGKTNGALRLSRYWLQLQTRHKLGVYLNTKNCSKFFNCFCRIICNYYNVIALVKICNAQVGTPRKLSLFTLKSYRCYLVSWRAAGHCLMLLVLLQSFCQDDVPVLQGSCAGERCQCPGGNLRRKLIGVNWHRTATINFAGVRQHCFHHWNILSFWNKAVGFQIGQWKPRRNVLPDANANLW